MGKGFMQKNIRFLYTSLLSSFCLLNGTISAAEPMREMSSMEIVYDMKVGWNLGNTLDAWIDGLTDLTTETCWGNPYTTKAMIDMVKQKGFKTVRIPVTWERHFGEAPDYTIDEPWMDRVEDVVNYVLHNDMYAILNSHHDEWVVLKASSKDEVTDKLTKIWAQIAERFKDYSDYLIFEVLNEPRLYGELQEWSGGTPEARQILNEYNLAVVNTIRSSGGNNAQRHIMIPTHAATSIDAAQDDLVIPNDDSRIIVSQHTYWPYNFTMNTNNGATDKWGSDSDKEECDLELDRIYDKFCARGIPVVIGEWGSINRSNTEDRAVHAGYYARAARERGMLPVWWDNGYPGPGGDGFALLDREAGEWFFPSIVDSLIQGAGNDTTKAFRQMFHTSEQYTKLKIYSGLIGYFLPAASTVSLSIFTMQGKNVFTSKSDVKPAGYHTFSLPTNKVSSGNYIVKLKSERQSVTKNINITK